jgi:hypothetical protein
MGFNIEYSFIKWIQYPIFSCQWDSRALKWTKHRDVSRLSTRPRLGLHQQMTELQPARIDKKNQPEMADLVIWNG